MYQLIDSGDQRKLEQFGDYIIERPCSQAIWPLSLKPKRWKGATAAFSRQSGSYWTEREPLPESWIIEVEGIKFKLSPTDFGHLGIFPEQSAQWRWMQDRIQEAKRPVSVLNLFAYSGGSTMACAIQGAKVCHVDASKGMVSWANDNAAANKLDKGAVRWIVDDVLKFLKRELRRGNTYDAIILDPPTFGRGSKGEVFKIERDIMLLLELCRDILSDQSLFFLYSCHTPGFTPIVLEKQLRSLFPDKTLESGEMLLQGNDPSVVVPSGCYARWSNGS